MKTSTLSKVLLATLALSATAWAKPPEFVTKEVTGEAAIVNGDEAKAEKEAREQALRTAVEQVAGLLISSDTITQNNQLLRDRVFANTSGYVRKHEVLSKVKEKGVMKVTVRAEVGTVALDKDLVAVQSLISRMGNRRLVILLSEDAVDSNKVVTSSKVLTTVLTDAFKKDGWTIIDPSFAAGKLKLESGVALSTPEMKEIEKLTNADYILKGRVTFRYQPPNKSGIAPEVDAQGNQIMFNVTGEYDLAFFATDSGDQLKQYAGKFNTGDMGKKGSNVISYERTAFDISRAHGEKILSEFRGAILESLRDAEMNGNRVVVSVKGLPDYAAVQDFKKAVGVISNVREVRPGQFGGGKAEFDIVFVGTTDDLADKISAATFKRKKLSVTGVTGNTLEVTVAK